jgi:hypothetical protein
MKSGQSSPRTRRPVGVATEAEGFTIVVCSDGAVFHYKYVGDDLGAEWIEARPIPGSTRAERLGYGGLPYDGPITEKEDS